MLPSKGRIILAPSTDTSTDVPRVILPEDVTQPPMFIPGPAQPPIPTNDGESLLVVDVSAQMPREPANGPFGTELKRSLTFHWLGGDYSREASDNESLAYLQRVAYDHIRKNWGTDAAPAFGNGIMYHEAITPLGTILVMRDYTEIVWHCAVDLGNRTSRAILIMCGPNTPPTDAQNRVMRIRWDDFGRIELKGHQEWSATQCPGPEVMAKIRELRNR